MQRSQETGDFFRVPLFEALREEVLRAIHLVETEVRVDFRSKQQEVRLLGPHLGGEKDGLENVEEGKTSDGEKPLGQTLKCTEKGCDFRADVEDKRRR